MLKRIDMNRVAAIAEEYLPWASKANLPRFEVIINDEAVSLLIEASKFHELCERMEEIQFLLTYRSPVRIAGQGDVLYMVEFYYDREEEDDDEAFENMGGFWL